MTLMKAGVGPGSRPDDGISHAVAYGVAVGSYAVAAAVGAYAGWSSPSSEVIADPSHTPAVALFWHNLGVLVWIAGGLVTAGAIVVGVMALNGALIGWVVGNTLAAGHAHLLVTAILPQFALELLAYVISAAATLRLGTALARRLWRRRIQRSDRVSWRPWLQMQARAVVLLLAAALIEANFSHV